jgi:hypothetical protein
MATAGDGQVTLTFSASPGAMSYRAYWATASTVSTASTPLGTVTSPLQHQGLTNGVTYFYVVTAVNTAGESSPSSVVQARPLAQAGPSGPQVLSRRPDVGATNVRVGGRVDVRFDRDLDGTTATGLSVRLERVDGGVVPASVSAAGPTLAVTPASPLEFEAPYRVTLDTGLRSMSGAPLAAPVSWSFTTSSPPPALSASTGNQAVQLTWTAVSTATDYLVNRVLVQGSNRTSTTVTVTGNAFTDVNLSYGRQYEYTVQALTPFGVSPPSNAVTVFPSPDVPSAPTGLGLIVGTTTALLSSSQVSSVTGYAIYRGTAAGGPFTLVASNHPSTVWRDTSLPTGGSVAYVVQARPTTLQSLGPSVYSASIAEVLRTTALPAPPGLTVTPGDRWNRLAWSAVSGAEGYVVFAAVFPNGALSRVAWVTGRTSFDHRSVTNGDTYRYFVAASRAGDLGDFAEAAATPLPVYPPAAVQLRAPDPGVNSVSLTTTPPLTPGASVRFLRSQSADGGFLPIAGSTSSVDGGEPWFYAAEVVAGSQVSERSNVVPGVAVPAGVPAAPSNVVALGASGGAEVSWTREPLATAYQVGSSSAPGGPYSPLCTANDGFDTRCAPTLLNGGTWYLAVRAMNGFTPGPWSAEVVVRPTNLPPAPGFSRPTISVDEGNGTMTLWWTLVTDATEYRVFRRTRTSPWVLHRVVSQLGFEEALQNGLEVQYGVMAAAPATAQFSVMATTGFVVASASRPFRPSDVQVTPTRTGATVSFRPVAGITQVRGAASVASRAGTAPAGTITTCTSDGFEPCQLPLPLGTTYVLALQATAPGLLTSSWTPEVTVTPNLNSNAPDAPSISSASAGNGVVTFEGAPVAGTSHRLLRRTESSPYVEVANTLTPAVEDVALNGRLHTYLMQVVTADGASPWSAAVSVRPSPVAPLPPTVTALVPGPSSLAVEWAPVPGVEAYRVLVAPSVAGPFVLERFVSADEATRIVMNVADTSPRVVAVRSVNQSVLSARSAPAVGASSTTAVAAPVVDVIRGSEAVGLTWSAVTGASGYLVSRRLAGPFGWRPIVSLTGRRYVDQNVEPGETHQYAVQAVGPQGPGPWTLTLPQLIDASRLPLVRNVTVRPGNDALAVEWAPVPGATGYLVQSDASPAGPFTTNAVNLVGLGPFETRCRVPATNGVPLSVTVTAYASAGAGPGTPTPLTATPEAARPATPSLFLMNQGPGQLQVTLTAVSGATSYHVFRRTDAEPYTLLRTTTTTTFVDSGLTTGQRYWYLVEAENASGRGAPSGSVQRVAP